MSTTYTNNSLENWLSHIYTDIKLSLYRTQEYAMALYYQTLGIVP